VSLKALKREIAACRVCRDAPRRGPPLPHEPRPVLRVSATARICIAGQAPGTRVHASGVPFDDPSGDRLREWMGVGRDEFYDEARVAVVPMGFCFPGLNAKGADLPPRAESREIWHDRIFAGLPRVELLLIIGQYAHAYHLGAARGKTLTETVRNWRAHYAQGAPRRLLPLPHPSWRNNAWLKKNPWFDKELLPVLRGDIRTLLGRA
jgi:uracil-DNA glycosylase